MAQRSRLQLAWYHLLRALCGLAVRVLFCFRAYRRERIPADGPLVLLANHQSHLDPVLVGVASRRPLSFLARKSLFSGMFGRLIGSLNAIPVDRDGRSISGLREILGRLQEGEATLIFPEGTRTHDGRIGPLRGGFGILVRRSGATVVPLGIAGAYQAWPRHRRVPRPGRVTLHVGRPIPPSTTATLTEEQLLALIQRRIEASARIARLRGTLNKPTTRPRGTG